MGAAFGFGFVVGPAISGFTSHLGLWVPFAIAATVTAVAVVLTAIILPETNKHMGEIKKGKMFDLKKIATAIFDKNSGRTLTISLIYSLAFAMFIYAYQPMANKGLGLTPAMVAANFSIIGVMGIVGQMVVVPFLVKRFSEKKILVAAFLLQALTFVGFAMVGGWWSLIFVSILNSLSGAPIGPLINSILSKDADKASQGSILGLNASYIGLGNIFGPVVGGFLATIGLRLPFVIGGVLVALCSTITMKLAIKKASVHEF